LIFVFDFDGRIEERHGDIVNEAIDETELLECKNNVFPMAVP
jgi:hypothetical protein